MAESHCFQMSYSLKFMKPVTSDASWNLWQSWVVHTGKDKTEQLASSVESNFPNSPDSLVFDN